MLSATFDDRGGGANDLAFSMDLTISTAIFHSPEILKIFRGNCYTSQGDPDSSFPLWIQLNVEFNKCELHSHSLTTSLVHCQFRKNTYISRISNLVTYKCCTFTKPLSKHRQTLNLTNSMPLKWGLGSTLLSKLSSRNRVTGQSS